MRTSVVVVVVLLLVIVSCSTVDAQQEECSDGLTWWQCCIEKIPILPISSICGGIEWDSDAAAITANISVNSIVVWSQTYTNPDDPIEACVDLLGCKACIEITDIDVTNEGCCGTVELTVSCFGINDQWDLGSFHLGSCPSSSNSTMITSNWATL